ncbi:MAG TPA: glycosyltransferase family 4 protein [Blastocatellia bacterium]|nr:glycosyltransferase family 4 protein [Blastocatellia bacterium]
MERGWEFEVWFMAATEAGRYWRFDADAFNFPHRFLYGKSLNVRGATLHLNPSILRRLRAQPAEVVLVAGGWALPTNVLLSLAQGLVCRPQLIFWSESHLHSTRRVGWAINWLRTRLLRRYHGFAVPGELARTYVQHYAPNRPVHLFSNTVNEALFRDTVYRLRQNREALRRGLRIPNDRRVLLIPARLRSEKGVSEFLSSLDSLPAAIKQATTVFIAGDGPLKERIRQQFARPDSLDVRLMGHLEESEMLKLYALADGFALPSLYDPNPLAVVEALWASLPLLLSDRVGNHPEALRAGRNGWLFDPRSSSSICEAFLQWCAASPQALAACGAVSLSLAEAHFETRKVVQTLLDNLLKEKLQTCAPLATHQEQV